MAAPLLGPVVLRLLNAFNHLFFILPVEDADILRSRLESDALSTLEANKSFCKEKRRHKMSKCANVLQLLIKRRTVGLTPKLSFNYVYYF